MRTGTRRATVLPSWRQRRWLAGRRRRWRPETTVTVDLLPGAALSGLDRDMAALSITLLADAPMLSRDDIDYLHELADGGVTPATTPTAFRPCERPGQPAAGDRRDRCLRPDPGLGRTLCGPAARRGRADHPHPLSRRHHGFLMRSEATARGRIGDCRGRCPATGEVRTPSCRSSRLQPPVHRNGWRSTRHPDGGTIGSGGGRIATRTGVLMLTQEQRMQLSDILRPASPPREIDNICQRRPAGNDCSTVHAEGPYGSSLSTSPRRRN